MIYTHVSPFEEDERAQRLRVRSRCDARRHERVQERDDRGLAQIARMPHMMESDVAADPIGVSPRRPWAVVPPAAAPVNLIEKASAARNEHRSSCGVAAVVCCDDADRPPRVRVLLMQSLGGERLRDALKSSRFRSTRGPVLSF
jgi:hypothetical protein